MKHLLVFSLLCFSLMLISCKSKGAEDTSSNVSTEPGSIHTGLPYEIDTPRSELKWQGFKPTGSHYGIVPITGGTIYVDGDLITGGTININMSRLQAQGIEGEMKDNLERHLKGTVAGKEDDFFNVNKYPTALFTILGSTKLENDPLGTHLISGDLKIKDISKPVSFKAMVDLSSGVALKATTEPFVIDRTQWDIRFKSKKFFADIKDDFISDEIKLELTIGAVKGVKNKK